MKNGFTLVEMMIAISVLAVLVLGGTMIFYKTLSSGSLNQATLNTGSSSGQVLAAIESNIRYKKVYSVTDAGSNISYRSTCLANGSVPNGKILTVYDNFGTTNYKILNNQIASDSGVVPTPVISTSNLRVVDITFTWFCTPGANDIVRVLVTTNDINTAGTPNKTFSKDINMYNSY